MNKKINTAGILGIGSSVPDKILTNFDLEKMVDTSDEWISKRTGISERRILDDDMPAYKMGAEAAKKALEDADIKAEEIDLIIVATTTPDYIIPATSCIIQNEIGAVNAAAFDLVAACSGLIYGMSVAEQYISNGTYKHVLVIGCEALSRVTDWQDRNTCVLFGDGAGAVVLGPVEKDYGLISTKIGADGSLAKLITLPNNYMNDEDMKKRIHENKHVLYMEGSEVFKFAVKVMTQAVNTVLNDAGLTIDDIKLIVPHQANIRIIEGAAKRIGASEDKIVSNINKYGNISSASIPVALNDAVNSGRVQKGDNIVLVGFGGGLTWAASLIKWSK